MASADTGRPASGRHAPRDWSMLLLAFWWAGVIAAFGFVQQERASEWPSRGTAITMLLLGLHATLTGYLLFRHPSSVRWLARRTSWPKAYGAMWIGYGTVLAIQQTNLLFRLVPEPFILWYAPGLCFVGIWAIALAGQRLGIWSSEE